MAAHPIEQSFQLALKYHQSGQVALAETLYRNILSQQPQHAGALLYLGVAAQAKGQYQIALDLIGRSVAIAPQSAEACANLGNVLASTQRYDEAIAAFRHSLALKQSPLVYYNLGKALFEKGVFEESISALRQSIAIVPRNPDAHRLLGDALQEVGQSETAIGSYQQAIALQPNFPDALNNLGNAFRTTDRLDEAIAAYRRVIALRPDHVDAWGNLAVVLKITGLLDESVAAYRKVIALTPDRSGAWSNLLYTIHYHPGFDGTAIAEEHRQWHRLHAEPLAELIQPHLNDRDPNRRLRVGYVTADFRKHPVGRFMLPLLAHHDKSQFETFVYSNSVISDEMTDQLRAAADWWRAILGLSDVDVANQIRRDQIDILVDLSMHSSGNRLLVFARKPAPMQVSYLAYCSTTGLKAMNFRLSDRYFDPGNEDETVYTEQTLRLPGSYWVYEPIVPELEVGPPPFRNTGQITFGCLNNFIKMNEAVSAVWVKILLAVPGSELLLHTFEGSHREQLLERIERDGVNRSRIRFVGRMLTREYFELYNQIDIALDPFPYGGGTTTCDALWMGVPVVSLIGATAVGRAGFSILSTIGLPELAARSQDDYVQIAAELAGDADRLAELRSTVRQRMQQSPLMDAPRFARDVETVYRQIWRIWAAS